jgi:hypothetical protein
MKWCAKCLNFTFAKDMNECGAKIESMEKTYETYLHWLNIILPQKYAA